MDDEKLTPEKSLDPDQELPDGMVVEVFDEPARVSQDDDDDNKRLARLEARLASMKRDRTDLAHAKDLISETGGLEEVDAGRADILSEMYNQTLHLQNLKKEIASIGLFGARRKKELAAEIAKTEQDLNSLDASWSGRSTMAGIVKDAGEKVKKSDQTGPSKQYMDDRIAEVEAKIAELKEKIGDPDQSESKS